MRQLRDYPRLVVTRKAIKALRQGHPWVFEGEVLEMVPAPGTARGAVNGDIVDVVGENGSWQGSGLYSERSKIRCRIVSRNANDRFDEAFWRRRVTYAWRHREATMGSRTMCGQESDLTCCRVVFSEADGMPGLTCDKYGDVLVCQVTTYGMERLRDVVYPLLMEVLEGSGHPIAGIFERNDVGVRLKEGLDLYKSWWGEGSHPDTSVKVFENGLTFALDIENSQKTGFFLDQKYNRRAVRELSLGRRVLDCFCHVGPFGLGALAGGAEFCRFVDVSEQAISLARANAELNGFTTQGEGAQAAFTCANVLEWLPSLRDRGRLREAGGPFDLIVLDPPAFTKSSSSVRSATHGYAEINRLAMQILPRGGYLCTCSCSQHMTRDRFLDMVSGAARDAGVQLRQVEERQQAPDHPILLGFPESHYLDFFTFQVV